MSSAPAATTRLAISTDARSTVAAGTSPSEAIAAQVFRTVIGPAVTVQQLVADGEPLVPGEPALVVQGPTAGLLTAERTALNLVTHLSGIATATRIWVDAVAGTGAKIRDTRKTLPGLRALEKYAVRFGGGVNHRMSLGDAALIKDNHVAAAGSVTAAIKAVRALDATITLEVEVDTLAQLDEAIGAGAELVLLDNFTLADTVEAVRRVRALPRPVRLEASGGLTLDRARAVAQTGVDFLAVGALTHSAPALDVGLDLVG